MEAGTAGEAWAGPQMSGLQGLLPVHRADPRRRRPGPDRGPRLRVLQGGRQARPDRHRRGDPRHRPDRQGGGGRDGRRPRGGRRVRRRAAGLRQRRRHGRRRGGARARARTRSWPSAAGRSWTRPRPPNVIFTHGGEPREWEGYFGLPRDDDGLGRPHDLAPLACLPDHRGHRLGGVVRGGHQGPRRAHQVPGRGPAHVPAPRGPRPRVDAHAAAAAGGRDRHGRDDARDRGPRVLGVEPARVGLRAAGACG